MDYIYQLTMGAELIKRMAALAIFTGRMKIWVRLRRQLALQALIVVPVSLARRIYLDLCANIHRIGTVSGQLWLFYLI
jgi:hypothetical protein